MSVWAIGDLQGCYDELQRLLERIAFDPARDRRVFANVVREAFGQRRKTLRNALSQICDAPAMEAAGISPQARAEQVAVADFIRLANMLAA